MRARNIKPSFFKNEELAKLPIPARYLFAGLWCLADREGRLEDRPVRIKAEVFPYENQNVSRLLDLLAAPRGTEPGFITRYDVSGKKYIQIDKFRKHQSPHVKEPASTIPSIIAGNTEHQTSTMQEPGETGATSPESPILNVESPFLNEEPPTPALAADAARPSPDQLAAEWNVVAERMGLPVCRELNADRRKHAAQRLREKPDLVYWRSVIARIGKSSFCRGETDRGWRADFDFLCRRNTHLRVLEGKYDDASGYRTNPKTRGNVESLSSFVRGETELVT